MTTKLRGTPDDLPATEETPPADARGLVPEVPPQAETDEREWARAVFESKVRAENPKLATAANAAAALLKTKRPKAPARDPRSAGKKR